MWRGADVGMTEEIPIGASLNEVGGEIVQAGAVARDRHDRIMDIHPPRRRA